MKTWVVTGGIACGKGEVIERLNQLLPHPSVSSFSSDAFVQSALRSPEVISSLLDIFGPAVALGGEIDRPWLREQILLDPGKRSLLEGVLHPLVLSALEDARIRSEASGSNLFLAEVPLHYEIGASVSADFVIVVASSRSVQVRRMVKNRGLDEQSAQQFLNAQWPIEAKVEKADAVIWNDGNLASLQAQVLTLASPFLQE